MRKKFKVTLVVFLVVVLGCFSQAFAATNQGNKTKKISQVMRKVRMLDNATDDGGVVGTSNLDGTEDNSAKVGDQLTSPEIGWKRYDDSNKKIVYTGTWYMFSDSYAMGNFDSALHDTSPYGANNASTGNTAQVEFKFYGTKFRIISFENAAGSTNNRITVDGVAQDKPLSCCMASNVGSHEILTYDVETLSLGIHTVKIENLSTSNLYFDAIDVDSTGYLID